MKNKLAIFVATWFCSGLIPPILLGGMAGTYGSFFSLPLCYLALWLVGGRGVFYWAVMLTTLIAGLWSIPRAEIALGERVDWKGKRKRHDQNQIVIDEVFGMLMACYPLTLVKTSSLWLALGSAFVLFRFFDIVKVPPAKFFDRMQNASGVMLDDLIAGIYAALVLTVLLLFVGL